MSKQCLDIEQMQHLKELGLDTSNASALYCIDNETGEKQLMLDEQVEETDKDDEYFRIVPAYTLQDILDLLPETIERAEGDFFLEIAKLNGFWYASYIIYVKKGSRFIVMIDEEELIDSAYEMLCWCVEKGHVETNKR